MSVNKLKVMLSYMREKNDGNDPSAADYGITSEELWDIIDACQDEGLIKGARFTRGGPGNPTDLFHRRNQTHGEGIGIP